MGYPLIITIMVLAVGLATPGAHKWTGWLILGLVGIDTIGFLLQIAALPDR